MTLRNLIEMFSKSQATEEILSPSVSVYRAEKDFGSKSEVRDSCIRLSRDKQESVSVDLPATAGQKLKSLTFIAKRTADIENDPQLYVTALVPITFKYSVDSEELEEFTIPLTDSEVTNLKFTHALNSNAGIDIRSVITKRG